MSSKFAGKKFKKAEISPKNSRAENQKKKFIELEIQRRKFLESLKSSQKNYRAKNLRKKKFQSPKFEEKKF